MIRSIISLALLNILYLFNIVNAQSFIKIRPAEDNIVANYNYSDGVMSGMSLHEYFQNTGKAGTVIVSATKSGNISVNVANGEILKLILSYKGKSMSCLQLDNTDVQIYLSSTSGKQSFTESISSFYVQGTSIFVPTPFPGHFINMPGSYSRLQLDTCNTIVVTNWASSSSIQLSKSVSLQNYPNPFNTSTLISFILSSKSFVTLKVFDFMGREVENLVSEEMPSGNHSYQWNKENLPEGVYFCCLRVGSIIETRKLVLLK